MVGLSRWLVCGMCSRKCFGKFILISGMFSCCVSFMVISVSDNGCFWCCCSISGSRVECGCRGKLLFL